MAWVEAVSNKFVGRDKPRDIPESAPDSAAYSGEVDISMDIPDVYKAEPAVIEAQRVVKGRPTGTPLTVKNIKDALRRSRR